MYTFFVAPAQGASLFGGAPAAPAPAFGFGVYGIPTCAL